jgi:PBP1b-binding outer membrane lipoprotein LpoB
MMMNMTRWMSVMAGMAILSGCATPPSSPYVPATERGVTTAGLDTYDYQMVAAGLSQEMMRRGLPNGYVVALGPVDTRATPYAVDIQLLQDKLEVALSQNGTLKFTSAVNAMKGASGTEEIYKLIEYNWWQKNPMDTEDIQKFGKIANVGALLFGRISSMERSLPGRGREITYSFVWRLTDTATGVNQFTLEKEIRKNIR